MDDLTRLMLAAQAEAYEIAERTGQLPEKAEVSARFHMDGSGGVTLDRSSRSVGPIKMTVTLAPQQTPAGLQLLRDRLMAQAMKGQKKNTRKRTSSLALYQLQRRRCNGCDEELTEWQLNIDHIVPKSRGGSDEFGNLQLLCYHCNSLKADDTQEDLLAGLRERGIIPP